MLESSAFATDYPPMKRYAEMGISEKIAWAGYSAAHAGSYEEAIANGNRALVMRAFDRAGGKPGWDESLPYALLT